MNRICKRHFASCWIQSSRREGKTFLTNYNFNSKRVTDKATCTLVYIRNFTCERVFCSNFGICKRNYGPNTQEDGRCMLYLVTSLVWKTWRHLIHISPRLSVVALNVGLQQKWDSWHLYWLMHAMRRWYMLLMSCCWPGHKQRQSYTFPNPKLL